MIDTHPAAIAIAATGLTTCLLLAACGTSSAPTLSTTPAGQERGSAPVPSASSANPPTVNPTSAAQPPVSAQPAAADSACSLITESDVTSAVGSDPGKGTPDSGHGGTQCSYSSYATEVLLVNVLPAQGKASYNRVRDDPHLATGNGTTATSVTGLADQAFELSGPHTDAVYFTKGDALIFVGFTTRSSPPAGAALTLAKIAAGRL